MQANITNFIAASEQALMPASDLPQLAAILGDETGIDAELSDVQAGHELMVRALQYWYGYASGRHGDISGAVAMTENALMAVGAELELPIARD